MGDDPEKVIDRPPRTMRVGETWRVTRSGFQSVDDDDVELEELEAEAEAIIEGDSFTASDGLERRYPDDLAASDRQDYREFVEHKIAENADNHAQTITLDHAPGLSGLIEGE